MLSLPSRAQQFSIRYIWAKEVGIGPRWAIIWLFLLGSVFALVYGAIKLIPLVELGTKVQEAIKARAHTVASIAIPGASSAFAVWCPKL